MAEADAGKEADGRAVLRIRVDGEEVCSTRCAGDSAMEIDVLGSVGDLRSNVEVSFTGSVGNNGSSLFRVGRGSESPCACCVA